MLNFLLIEDESLFAKSVKRRLEREGHHAKIADNISTGQKLLQSESPDILLLDVRLPDGNGLDLLTEIRAEGHPMATLPVIVMTAYGELEDAVSAMKFGASDYLKKPVDLDELMLTIDKVVHNHAIRRQLDFSEQRAQKTQQLINLIGSSQQIMTIRNQAKQLSELMDKNKDTTPVVLITGETGSGKGVLARYFHQISHRYDRPFVNVDCAALPDDAVEAELFGQESYYSLNEASKARPGLIEVAEDGTLFLDEIAELSLSAQTKLLNVIERRQLRRLGSTREIPVNSHVIVSTNRDLHQLVASGEFRADLYFRLNVVEITLPPLRHRQQDIAELAQFFIEQFAKRYGVEQPRLAYDAMRQMQQYDWPGNIRELENVLERAVMLCKQSIIEFDDLLLRPFSQNDNSEKVLPEIEKMTMDQVEKYLLESALNRSSGNVSRAARQLGLTRMAMRYRMEKYKL
ncbi:MULTISPECIES: sigma-54 dependent transcriptional regulator [unclassified Methylophaga]|jgi:DNA-binding NtrC family response regulator|uniref:sigma-54-dependent transcriptional regulator n=2 Tax=Methylophaga TaxID=40222 RepID=UPI000C9173B2|nr:MULTISPECIES: sigma-54 dependent transcriptional regulator [unclassified Methylophaga]MAK67325.1 sigma-54-dependent Fis family transcriptional regulator [Methylophaga sp.]MAY16867.1 sigma-54-dependent Fis family transcriptional regulator [Methylophaga sp.]|tara:strand:+ start:3863 stop:5242 length:1380 start_codon:yes stop_codon:yes gene_type:complete